MSRGIVPLLKILVVWGLGVLYHLYGTDPLVPHIYYAAAMVIAAVDNS